MFAARNSGAKGASFVRTLTNQVTVSPNNKVHVAKGPGGRNSTTGHVATVFGASGLLGQILVSKLARTGTQVIVPYRDPDEVRHLKVTGDLGQIVLMEWDLRREDQIADCLRHSDTVYNCVGRNYETKNFSFADVNVSGARKIAHIAKEEGAERLVHVSHLNADADSPSAFYRTKYEGEETVKSIFPSATIIKPSWMYGHEDNLLETIARHPMVFRVNDGQTRVAPVHVNDVAEAMKILLTSRGFAGETFGLPGPRTYTYESLLQLIQATILKKLTGPQLPKPVFKALATAWTKAVWWPTIGPDDVLRRYISDKKITPDMKTFKDLYISPDYVEDQAIVYLRKYRSSAYADIPIEKGGLKITQGPYHVVE